MHGTPYDGHYMKQQRDDLAPIRLKKREERRVRAGHLWVYSNEIDTKATPLKDFEAGQPVVILAYDGKALGTGYVNPHSLICARLVSHDSRQRLDKSLFLSRLTQALALRERLFSKPFYRLVHGEADGLPGLVVDRYDEHLVVQCTTAGIERLRNEFVAALEELLQPKSILLRNDSEIRVLEGLERYVESIGNVPQGVQLQENGVEFFVPLQGGQKTGWYYDQRDNRASLRRYVSGKQVLDLFSYLGAWGVQAAALGAEKVLCVDSSHAALEGAGRNAALNKVEACVETCHGDVFEVLRALGREKRQFDVVILDPPAFIKRRKDHKKGTEAYQRLNRLALRVLSEDGILVSASCSFHLSPEQLQNIVLQSSRRERRSLQILERGFQAADHPVHPAIPETAYIKAFFCRVLRE